MPTPSTGYTIADVSTLTAIAAADRADGYARLLLDDGNGRRVWVAYDDAATDGDFQPDDTPTTGYWKIVESSFFPIFFYVTNSGGQAIVDASNTVVEWGTPTNDTESGWNATNNEWVAQNDCYLQINAGVQFDNEDANPDAGRTIVFVEQDLGAGYEDAARVEVTRSTTPGAETIPNVNVALSLDAGDKIRILAYQSSGQTIDINVDSGRGFFSLLGWRR